MPIKRLTHADVNDLRDLVGSRSSVKGMMSDDVSLAINYRAKWVEGMQRYYLVGNDTHYLYGYYHDGRIMSCMGWRCDLPQPWDDGWVVGHLKTRPGVGLRTSGMVDLWRSMFEICEEKGLKRWHMLIPEGTRDGYQSVADRFFSDIDNNYDYEWSLVVPANTKPDVDWVWGTMGRVEHDKEIRLRTGTKKCA